MLALRQERQRRGWSLAQVTMKTGISESNLSALERGRVFPHPGWQSRIAKAFHVTADELFKEVEND